MEGEPVRAGPVALWQRLWRSARRRPALVAKVLGAVALLCVLLAFGWYLWVADQLALRRGEEKYQNFAQRHNEALIYGLLAPDQGALFLGVEASAALRAAELAAREALVLAGMKTNFKALTVDTGFPAQRRSEIAADAYTLLLVLPSMRAQQLLACQGSK